MTSKIEQIKNKTALKIAWNKIFVSKDPFSLPFQSSITNNLMLYPTFGYHLSEKQFYAIRAACNAIGEIGFYMSWIEWTGDMFNEKEHWSCDDFPSHEDYLEVPLIVENAVYSKNGKWGILISHENHAIVGGCESFINSLKANYQCWENDIVEIKDCWKDSKNGGWLKEYKFTGF